MQLDIKFTCSVEDDHNFSSAMVGGLIAGYSNGKTVRMCAVKVKVWHNFKEKDMISKSLKCSTKGHCLLTKLKEATQKRKQPWLEYHQKGGGINTISKMFRYFWRISNRVLVCD